MELFLSIVFIAVVVGAVLVIGNRKKEVVPVVNELPSNSAPNVVQEPDIKTAELEQPVPAVAEKTKTVRKPRTVKPKPTKSKSDKS